MIREGLLIVDPHVPNGGEDVWGGRVGRVEGAGVWVWGVTLKHMCSLSEQEACHDLRRVI